MLGNRGKPIKYRRNLQKFRHFLLAFNGFSQIYLSAAQMLNAIIAEYSQITHGKHQFSQENRYYANANDCSTQVSNQKAQFYRAFSLKLH